MSGFTDELARMRSAAARGDNWVFASVTQLAPLRVRLDTDAAELSGVTPVSLVANLIVGDRVFVQLHGLQPIVMARVNGQSVHPDRSPISYTPDWINIPTSGLLAIGNGTIAGRYTTANGWCFLSWFLVRGSTTNVGTGAYAFSLPIAIASDYRHANGMGYIVKAGVETPLGLRALNSTTVALLNGTGRISNANPGTWAANDELHGEVAYPIA